MTIDKYFFNRFKRDNPREHYNLVLDALDDLSRQFTSATEMAEYLNNLTLNIKNEKARKRYIPDNRSTNLPDNNV